MYARFRGEYLETYHRNITRRRVLSQQRSGRIIRQGNRNETVHIYRYVTKDTFDSYLYQTVENKQKFISQIMTSKSPVRSAEDIDETALSYAEIKALATGNPHIKEKMELDTEVARLKLMKSGFLSQRYDLEDKAAREYPRQIQALTQRIEGYEKDISTAKSHPKTDDGFNPMTIDGIKYSEKEAAGKALLERCKGMTDTKPVEIGGYRGFNMELLFDEFTKNFVVTLKGSLSHNVELGTDVYGNIRRLDNALEAMPVQLDSCRQKLTEVKSALETAKAECKKEFPREAELSEKLKRLAELNAELNMDKHEPRPVDLSEPEEEPVKKKHELER